MNVIYKSTNETNALIVKLENRLNEVGWKQGTLICFHNFKMQGRTELLHAGS